MNKRQHKHHIDVETEEELVTVTIGSDGGVPGGFAKLFNRVVDSEAWARLSDAARAVYVPLVRFADHRNQFRVQIGRAGMMKYTALSQSSIKRAIKDLIAHKLVIVIEQGGVSDIGQNESNVYQLLVPADSRKRTGAGTDTNPQGVRQRTPSPSLAEPPVRPVAAPHSVPDRTDPGVPAMHARGVSGGPQLRNSSKENKQTVLSSPPRFGSEPSSVERAAVLLEEKGVECNVARQLAQTYPFDRVVDVIAAMEWRRSRGKCDNPGGFIRDALVKQWETPKAVVDARTRAEARGRAEEAERRAKASVQREIAQVGAEENRIEQRIASLDDDELTILAQAVLDKYQGNAAVIGVLTRKPPRECRLMKMEIAAMLAAV